MTIGILPDEIITIDNGKCGESSKNKAPRKIVEEDICGNSYEMDNYANASRINIHNKSWSKYTSNRCKARTISILFGLVTAVVCNIIFIVLFFNFKDVTFAWFGNNASQKPLAKPTWTERNDKTLRQVMVFFRHGAISPSQDMLPYYLNKNYNWEDGYETLTKTGMKNMYDLGQWLRGRYVFLNKGQYSHENTLAKSVDLDYCITSTQSLLAGLYPPSPEESLFDKFLWRPIPVHTIPRDLNEEDFRKTCQTVQSRKNKLLRDFPNDDNEISKILTPLFIKKLIEVTGMTNLTASNYEELKKLFHVYESQKAERLAVQNMRKKNTKLGIVMSQFINLLGNDTQVKKITMGPILNEIITHMENAISPQKESAPKIVLYGVESNTLINMLGTLEAMNSTGFNYPGYGYSVIFELHHNNAYPYLKLFYLNNFENEELMELDLTHKCGTKCLLSNFKLNHKDILADSIWKTECGVY